MLQIPTTLASEVGKTYRVDNNTFFQTVKDDKADFLDVEIGDSKQADFYPQIKVKRWDNEVNFSVRLLDDAPDQPAIRTSGKTIKWVKQNVEAHFYDYDGHPDFPEGGHEFEVLLKQKPASNVLRFSIQTKGLDFFYQPALTPEEIAQGAQRPENVVGSYEVYHKEKAGDYSRLGGKDYKAGKAFHIFRPNATDAKGKTTWCDLHIDDAGGILTVSVPQEFLDGAVYPVLIDPTFGYTTKGGSQFHPNQYYIVGLRVTGAAGTANSISSYTANGNDPNSSRYALYRQSDRARVDQTDTFTPSGTGTNTKSFLGQATISAIDYWITVGENDGKFWIYYTSGVAGYGSSTYSFGVPTMPDPMPSPTTNSNKYSIWVTYTAGGPTTVTKTHTADSYLAAAPATVTKTHTSDGLTLATQTKIHTADGLLLATQNKPHTSDAYLATAATTITVTHGTDSFLRIGPIRRAVGSLATGTTSITVSQPTGTSTGDFLIAFIVDRATSGTTSGPTGWTRVANGAGTGGRIQVFVATVGQNGLTGTSWTWSGLTTRACGAIVGYYPSKANNVIGITGTPTARRNASTGSGTTQVTTTLNNAVVVGAFASFANGATWLSETCATAGALAEQSDAAYSTYLSLAIADLTKAAAGATGASSATMSVATNNGGALIAIGDCPIQSHSSNTFLYLSPVKTFTTDSLLLKAQSNAHTADGYLVDRLTKSQTADALLKATSTSEHTADTLAKATQSRTHGTDSYLAVAVTTITKTHTADSLIFKTQTKAQTTDSLKRASFPKTHTTDALLKASQTKSHSADSYVVSRPTKTETTDALLKATFTRTHATDSYGVNRLTKTHSTDSLLKATSTKSHTTDAYRVSRVTKTHATDALSRATQTKTHASDVYLVNRVTKAHAADALLKATGAKAHITDSYAVTRQIKTQTTDSALKGTFTQTHSTDSRLYVGSIHLHNTDALLLAHQTKAHTADALAYKQATRNHGTDSLLFKTQSQAQVTDALLRKTQALIHTTDTLRKALQSRQHSGDSLALKQQTAAHSTDARLLTVKIPHHSADALLLKAQAHGHDTDADLKGTVVKAHSTDSRLFVRSFDYIARHLYHPKKQYTARSLYKPRTLYQRKP
jgi:hypothetical protein